MAKERIVSRPTRALGLERAMGRAIGRMWRSRHTGAWIEASIIKDLSHSE